MRITLLALEGLFDTGLMVLLDAFSLANKFAAMQMGGSPHFDVTVVGVRKKVRSGQGIVIPVQAITPELNPDWVVVPALGAGSPDILVPALERADVRQAAKQLLAWREEGVQIAASCIGTFILAEAGLLDGREATTTWWLAPLFRQRYPQVKLDESRMLVPTDVGVTAGAAMGHLDLALWLIRRVSPELAHMVSRYLLADIRRSQAPYIIPNHLAQADPLILKNLNAGHATSSSTASHWMTPRTRSRPVRARCNGAARRFSVSRRLRTSRTCVLNVRSRCYMAVAWTSKRLQRKWVMKTAQRCGHCYASGSAKAYAICVQT